MGHDPFSPITSATINVLCTPAGRITVERYESAISWLSTHLSTTTGHAVSGGHPDLPIFLNFSGAQGENFVDQSDHFEPNRNVQLVLGIVDGDRTRATGNFEGDLSKLTAALTAFTNDTIGGHVVSELLIVFGERHEDLENLLHISLHDEAGSSIILTRIKKTARVALENGLQRLQHVEALLPKSKAESQRPPSIESPQEINVEDARRQSIMSTFARTPTVASSVTEEDQQPTAGDKTISAAIIKLQMGLWTEALDQLGDGARSARDSNHPAWHGKALEAILLTLLLHAWAGMDFQIPQNCYPTNRGYASSSAVHSISEANRGLSERFASSSAHRLQALTAMLPSFLATILNLYDRAAIGWDNSLPRILVCEARVRFACLLVAVRTNGGFIDLKLLDILFGDGSLLRNNKTLDVPSQAMSLRNTSIAALLVEAVNESQAHLHVQASSNIRIAVCHQLTQLGLERKAGFYLRDVLQGLPPLLLEGQRWGQRKSHTSLHLQFDREYRKSQEGIRILLSTVLGAFGLPEQVDVDGSSDKQSLQTPHERLLLWVSIFLSGDIAPKLEVLRLCIRVCDAMPDYDGSLHFMALLLFVVKQSVTLHARSVNSVPLIAAEEQLRLVEGIDRTVWAARQHPDHGEVLAEYWDDFLVRDIALCEPATTGKLMAHSSADLTATTTSGTSKKDPFIYNPFSGDSKSSGPTVLVKDEFINFDVTLQNPLEIEIEIEEITLLADGCEFESTKHNLVVGPLSLQVVGLCGSPRAAGTLMVKGCRVRIKNCRPRIFHIFDGDWKAPIIVKRRSHQDISITLPSQKTLELKVVEPLPQLQIKSCTLAQPSIMLLDGETCKFGITLENQGAMPADLLLFTFQDSVSDQYQGALTNKELSPVDSYEMQYQLTHRATIRRIQEANTKNSIPASIEGFTTKSFTFEVLGKPGLTYATILVDYAYLGKPRNEFDGTFYTRQLRYTIQITVNGSVDIQRCSALSVPDYGIDSNERNAHISGDAHEKPTTSSPAENHCLLQLDLRSIWQSPMTVKVETAYTTLPGVDKEWKVATSITLRPAQYARTMLLFPRIYLINSHEPIPSVNQSNRQFVVSATRLSLETEMATREIFWYREEICKNLRLTWREEFGDKSRQGEIDVRRGIRPTPRTIDVLRIEHVQISFDLQPIGHSKEVNRSAGELSIPRNEPYKLVIKVHNRTQEDLLLLLRLHPCLHDQPHNIAMDLSRKFVWTGVLQQVVRGGIKSGEIAESSLEITGLAYGLYEVNATVEEVRPSRRAIEGVSSTNSNRRIWHARQPALIRVHQ